MLLVTGSQPAPILGRRLLLGRRVVVAQPRGHAVGRGHKRMSPGVAVPGRLRQGSATVQDLTSPIAPNCQFPLPIRCAASASKRVDTLLPAFAAGMRIHPAQPHRWETVRYAPLACTKRRYRPRNPLSFPDRGFAAQAWRRGISRSCHLVPLATSW
jgi:hypothetical protein